MLKRFAMSLILILPVLVAMMAGPSAKSPSQAPVFANQADVAAPRSDVKKRRIVIFGSHPEDPAFCCGGLIAKLASAGHEVIVACAASSRRNRQFDGEPEADVRRREAEAASQRLGTTSYLFHYDNHSLKAEKETVDAVALWLKDVKPDIVVTHWPLDTNANHHVTSSLVWQCYLRDREWNLYFFEGLTYYQTIAFTPELFLDITDVWDIKKEACFLHHSQKPGEFWIDQEDVQRQRGAECGTRYAEAFILAEPLPGRALLPVTFLKKSNGK